MIQFIDIWFTGTLSISLVPRLGGCPPERTLWKLNKSGDDYDEFVADW